MLYSIPEFLIRLEKPIEGSKSRKSGQAKRKFAELFGTSIDWIYRHCEDDKTEHVILCDVQKQQCIILKSVYSADTVF